MNLTKNVVRQESSEYETDSEEDETYGRQLLKPQFVPKAEREVRETVLGQWIAAHVIQTLCSDERGRCHFLDGAMRLADYKGARAAREGGGGELR